jgi:hypothetical protein
MDSVTLRSWKAKPSAVAFSHIFSSVWARDWSPAGGSW